MPYCIRNAPRIGTNIMMVMREDTHHGVFPDESVPDQCKAIIKKKAGRDSSLKSLRYL